MSPICERLIFRIMPSEKPVGRAHIEVLTLRLLGRKRWSENHIPLSPGGARGVMVMVVGNGHGDTSSNPGQVPTEFHIALIPLGKV